MYLHRFPNGKVYVGITSLKPSRRWKKGQGYKNKQILVYRAIKKYGWNSIEHLILDDGLTKEEAEKRETELILKYRANDPNYGYNVESGGSVNKHLADSTRQKLREINLGKHHTRETKEKLSASLKKAYVEGRKTLTKEHLQKMQDARRYEFEPWNKGKTIDTGARVYQFTKDGEFIKEWINGHVAQKELDIHHIYEACDGRRKTAGGYKWSYNVIP